MPVTRHLARGADALLFRAVPGSSLRGDLKDWLANGGSGEDAELEYQLYQGISGAWLVLATVACLVLMFFSGDTILLVGSILAGLMLALSVAHALAARAPRSERRRQMPADVVVVALWIPATGGVLLALTA